MFDDRHELGRCVSVEVEQNDDDDINDLVKQGSGSLSGDKITE